MSIVVDSLYLLSTCTTIIFIRISAYRLPETVPVLHSCANISVADRIKDNHAEQPCYANYLLNNYSIVFKSQLVNQLCSSGFFVIVSHKSFMMLHIIRMNTPKCTSVNNQESRSVLPLNLSYNSEIDVLTNLHERASRLSYTKSHQS